VASQQPGDLDPTDAIVLLDPEKDCRAAPGLPRLDEPETGAASETPCNAWWTLGGSVSNSSNGSQLDIPEVPDEGRPALALRSAGPTGGLGIAGSCASLASSASSPTASDRLHWLPPSGVSTFRRANSMGVVDGWAASRPGNSISSGLDRVTRTVGAAPRRQIAPLAVAAAVQTSVEHSAWSQSVQTSLQPRSPQPLCRDPLWSKLGSGSVPRTVPPGTRSQGRPALARNGQLRGSTARGPGRVRELANGDDERRRGPMFGAGVRVLLHVPPDDWVHTTVTNESPAGDVSLRSMPDSWLSLNEQRQMLRPAVSVYDVGDFVQYCAETGKWISTTVASVSATGHLQVDVRPGFWISPADQWHVVRPHPEQEHFAVGDEVAYYSTTHRRWQEARILGVRPNGAVEVDSKPGFWISVSQQASRVRRRPVGLH